jgi:RIO kinase 1
MKIPPRLQPLVDDGLVVRVVRQLMSGKEAAVFVVECDVASGRETRCAKVYKDAQQRSFRQAVDYTENRRTANTRDARAMKKGTAFGRKVREEAWQSAEVDALWRLAAAGVRVPRPFDFVEGVLLMELVTDADGNAAPRLNDVTLTADEARRHHRTVLDEVIRMLMAGVIHGDLSEFNILMGADGPVLIDLPQAVDAAGNNHAKAMLERDVTNLANTFGRFAPELIGTEFGKELWQHYERGTLAVGMPLTGRVARVKGTVDIAGLIDEIDDARYEEEAKRMRMAQT